MKHTFAGMTLEEIAKKLRKEWKEDMLIKELVTEICRLRLLVKMERLEANPLYKQRIAERKG